MRPCPSTLHFLGVLSWGPRCLLHPWAALYEAGPEMLASSVGSALDSPFQRFLGHLDLCSHSLTDTVYASFPQSIGFYPPGFWILLVNTHLLLFPENELPGQSGTPKLLTQGVLEMVSHHCSGQEFTWHFFYLCQYRAQLFFLIFLLQVQSESRCWEAEDGMV